MELKSRCPQSCPSGDSKEESVPCLSHLLEAVLSLWLLASQPMVFCTLVLSSHEPLSVALTLLPASSKDPCDYIGPT